MTHSGISNYWSWNAMAWHHEVKWHLNLQWPSLLTRLEIWSSTTSFIGVVLFFKVAICTTKITQLEIMHPALPWPHPTQNCALANLDCPTVHGHKLFPCELHTKQLNHIIKIFLSDGDLSSEPIALSYRPYPPSCCPACCVLTLCSTNFSSYSGHRGEFTHCLQTWVCYCGRLAVPTEVCLKNVR